MFCAEGQRLYHIGAARVLVMRHSNDRLDMYTCCIYSLYSLRIMQAAAQQTRCLTHIPYRVSTNKQFDQLSSSQVPRL